MSILTQAVDLAVMPFKEQVDLVSNVDILMGNHRTFGVKYERALGYTCLGQYIHTRQKNLAATYKFW